MAIAGGDWLAIPWKDSTRRRELDSLFEVDGIPCLVIVDEHGNIINKNARGAIGNDPTGDSFPWAPPAVGNLSSPEGINDTPAICVFMESASPEHQKKILAELEAASKKCVEEGKSKKEEPKYVFFAAQNTAGVVARIREACGLPSDAQQVTMLLLTVDDDGAYYTSDAPEVSVSSIEGFIRSFESGSLQRKQMSP